MKRKHKFEVGQRVRRSRRWWKTEKPFFYGTVLEHTAGFDNSGRPTRAYRVCWDGIEPPAEWSKFLECELEATDK